MMRLLPNIADRAPSLLGNLGLRRSAASGRKIAILTSVPKLFEVLTCGLDPYAASRVSITPYSIRPFLERENIVGLDVTLFFVPALTGEWSQDDEGCLSQLQSALNTGGPYDRVLNICHAIPLYRRSRKQADQYDLNDKITAARLFGDTLVALAALSRQLDGKLLEPQTFGKVTYPTRGSRRGLMTISNMKSEPTWIDSHNPIWNRPTPTGLTSLENLTADFPGWEATGRTSAFKDLFTESDLNMGTLLNRFYYSEVERDFDLDSERLWDAKGEERLLSDPKEIFSLAIKKHCEDGLHNALKNDAVFTKAREDLEKIIGDPQTMKMVDISSLLGLKKGALPEDAQQTAAARRFMLDHPITVAFQQLWDRNAYEYSDEALAKKTNAWYLSNGLIKAILQLQGRIPKVNLLAIPTLPTNSVRFVSSPTAQEINMKRALVEQLSSLAVKQLNN